MKNIPYRQGVLILHNKDSKVFFCGIECCLGFLFVPTEKQLLPLEWQLAPVFALTPSPDGKTITAGGNFYGVVPYEGRYDGLLISGFRLGNKSEDAVFAGSMPSISGEVRDAKWITVKNDKKMLLARNNMPLLLLKPTQ